ncbi:amidohydrolase [Maribacter algarum]|uniref:Amidohydrolase n=1 Tax=Maribacter algarum (ex Zhang et al. 2020) TaxID=2578118 RepID=A0A5S3PN06_9FLAO|nr:amidohydrolase [Maribacter algarum]TMM55879.1 amidohydrolase [Maribacter algarum]
MKYLQIFLILLTIWSCQKPVQKADKIITNAVIWTGNTQQPYAQAMALVGDSIIAIGAHEEIKELKDVSTELVNAEGNFITPGFIDTHVHLMMGGNALLSVELRDANTPEEFTKRIASYANTLKDGQWILEGNWDHTLWGGELPNKEWIDKYTEDKPVALYRLDGHMILANSAALKIAGINKNTSKIESGEIVRNADGTPSGILKGNAMYLVLNKVPSLNQREKKNALRAATNYLLSKGVTSVHDMDSLGTYTAAKELKDSSELAIRIYMAKPLNRWNQKFDMGNSDNKWLKTGIVKGFVDGSLGSHTAAFKEPYTDKPDDSGFFINDEDKISEWTSSADKENLQVTIHAIGDKAIHSLLNTYEQVIKENGPEDRRFRVEHVQHIANQDISRFDELDVIASMQPYHAIDDGRWAEELIGSKRIRTTYAFKSLLDANAKLVFGSDWPVAPASPLDGIYAAVTRRTLDDKNPDGWVPEQKITVEQALKAYTTTAAYASFEEKRKGTLEPGKLADFVILSEDITKIDPVKIKNVQILKTYLGGIKVYDGEK